MNTDRIKDVLAEVAWAQRDSVRKAAEVNHWPSVQTGGGGKPCTDPRCGCTRRSR